MTYLYDEIEATLYNPIYIIATKIILGSSPKETVNEVFSYLYRHEDFAH